MDFKRRRRKCSPIGQPVVPRKAHGKSPAVPLRRAAAARAERLARGTADERAAPRPAPPPEAAAEAPAAVAAPEPASAEPTAPLRRAGGRELTAYGSPTPLRSRWRRVPEPIADPALRGPRPARERLWPAALVLLVVLAAAASAAYHWRDRLLPPTEPSQPPASAPVSDAVARLGSSDSDLPEIRRLLRRLDFAPGPDGAALDDATRAAIRQFQHMAGMPKTGEPSPALLDELRQVAAPLRH
jgi:hypothetical protein